MCREVHQTESLHELINIDASVLVKIDALGQVCNDIITDLCLEMRAQEFPGLAKFLVRDQTFRRDVEGEENSQTCAILCW